MEAEDPLSQLRDIHLPDAVTFWPPAPGWWALLVLIIIALAFIYRRAIARMIQRRKLAHVLDDLNQAYDQFNSEAAKGNRDQAGLAYLAYANALLNRVALVMYPETGSSHLSGEKWLAFLDSCDNTTAFSQGPGQVLADGIYRPTFDADAPALHALLTTWIEQRYTEKSSPDGILQSDMRPGT